jgi:hypothetical protein
VNIEFSKNCLWKKQSFVQFMFSVPLSRIRRQLFCGNISDSRLFYSIALAVCFCANTIVINYFLAVWVIEFKVSHLLYHLSHTHVLFYFLLFFRKVSHFSQCILGPWSLYLCTLTSWEYRNMLLHSAQPCCFVTMALQYSLQVLWYLQNFFFYSGLL